LPTSEAKAHHAYKSFLKEYVVAPADFVTIIPDGLKSEDAAPLLCGK